MPQGPLVRNPQTEDLLKMIGLDFNLDHGELPAQHHGGFHSQQQGLLSRSEQLPPPPPRQVTDNQVLNALSNPEEIDLDGDDDEEEEGAGEELKNDPMFQPI